MPPLVPLALRRRAPPADLAQVDAGVRPRRELPALISLAPAYPGYFLKRLKHQRFVYAAPSDAASISFKIGYEVRRELRGHGRGRRRWDACPVQPRPAFDKRTKRWQLEVRLRVGGKQVRTPYHRVVGLSVWPATEDSQGWCVEPFFVELRDRRWEVHHGDWSTRDCIPDNLWVLWRAVHRRMSRPR